MSGELERMQDYMGGVRAYFERARLMRRFVERVPPARFAGRVPRVLHGEPADLAEYHAALERVERRRRA